MWSCIGAVSDSKNQAKLDLSWNTKRYTAKLKDGEWHLNQSLPYFVDSLRIEKLPRLLNKNSPLQRRDFIQMRKGIPVFLESRRLAFQPIVYEKDTLAKKLFEDGLQQCQQGKVILEQHDTLKVINNQWGRHKINYRKDTLQVCIASNKDANLFGWRFILPKKEYGIIAFPAILYGQSAWGNAPKPKGIMPIGQIKNLKVDFDTELVIDYGRYNLAFDLWISNFSESPIDNPKMEIMVWEDRHPRSRPNGKKVDVLRTKNAVYDVFLGDVNRRKLNLRWRYVAFINQNKRQKGTTDLDEILHYLLKKKHITPQDYLGDIEFGTELVSGSGYLTVKQYQIRLNTGNN